MINPETKNISAELFLKNLANLPSISASLNMLDADFIGFADRKEIIIQTKSPFLIFCRKINNEIAAMCKKNSDDIIIFEFEELFWVQRLFKSIGFCNSELLNVTIGKINDMADFCLLIKENSSPINFTDSDRIKITQEVSIVRHQLHL